VAVADLLPGNDGPEVVNIYLELTILNGQNGAVLVGPAGTMRDGVVPIPGAGFGGAPTVADFDGDGWPEVSTAGSAAYVVYDPDCSDSPLLARAGGACASGRTDLILWSTRTQDLSSSRTGSSVFEFPSSRARRAPSPSTLSSPTSTATATRRWWSSATGIKRATGTTAMPRGRQSGSTSTSCAG
jgi:hypothetical protein